MVSLGKRKPNPNTKPRAEPNRFLHYSATSSSSSINGFEVACQPVSLRQQGRIMCGDRGFRFLRHCSRHLHVDRIQHPHSRVVQDLQAVSLFSLIQSLLFFSLNLPAPVYAFDSGRRGQLGTSLDCSRKSIAVPQSIHGFKDDEMIAVSANGDHSALLSANGHLYIWGRGFCGTSDSRLPQLLPSPLKFCQVTLGWNHALLLTDCGEVFMLGRMLGGRQESLKMQVPLCSTPSIIPDARLLFHHLILCKMVRNKKANWMVHLLLKDYKICSESNTCMRVQVVGT